MRLSRRCRAARRKALVAVLAVAALGGCAQAGRPPVLERSPAFGPVPASYTVAPGDTLYAIAWRFGLDYRALARANGIGPPYTIRAGQPVRLRAAAAATTANAAAPERRSRPSATANVPPSAERSRRTVPQSGDGWRAPTTAPIDRGFGDGNRGIDYRLAGAHRIGAAAAGEVVYAGSGLGGFRHLVIVKHDPAYLSAYSFDRPLAVAEGQRVAAGEDVARPERAGRPMLHFEIRRDGRPVNPSDLIGTRAG